MPPTLDPAGIRANYALIRPYIRRTPVIELDAKDVGLSGFTIFLKLECLQHSGSFKARGAFTNLLTRKVPAAGVVAASGGNHGAAVAYAAMRTGIAARIYVPTISSQAKIDRIQSYGATLCVGGDLYADALAASITWAEENSALQVHAYDQDETILGQGSVGLELSEQVPDATTVLAAVGGGGLISGLASWYQSSVPVFGVEPELAPTLFDALKAGRPVDAPAGGYAADSLAPKRIGERVFPIAQKHVRGVHLVSDGQIIAAQRKLWDVCRVVAEPGAATAFAALLFGVHRPQPGERVAVVVSGGNTTAVDFEKR